MAYTVQSTFAAGELDPELFERTTLEKYQAGLGTARNVIVTKAGGVIDRHARKFIINTKLTSRKVKLYSPPDSGYLIEWGHEYVRISSFDTTGALTLLFDEPHAFTEDDLINVRFESSKEFVYVFCLGKETYKINYTTGTFIVNTDVFGIPAAPTSPLTITPAGTPNGYDVDYAATVIIGGQESLPFVFSGAKLPIAAGQSNSIDFQISLVADPSITEVRYYRRPKNGGAYGFIGATTYFHTPSGTLVNATFTDLGQTADFSQSPPILVLPSQLSPLTLHSKVGLVYQQRLIITDETDLEAMYASRPGFPTNFTRDFPLNSASALRFKTGASGYPKVIDMVESDGLVVFTSAGVYLSLGALTPDNLSMDKKGKWKILDGVRPIALPGGVFFVDSATNTIRNLIWSQELATYNGKEISIYSNHLFKTRTITSWGFQEGVFPLLWVVFNDGQMATFTYEFDQNMRAWTRHDSALPVESVCDTGRPDVMYFVTVKGDNFIRQIECAVPRQIPAAAFALDSEVKIGESFPAMDGMVSWKRIIKDVDMDPGDELNLSPVVAPTDPNFVDAGAAMTLTDDSSGIFTVPGPGNLGYGAIGTKFRYFDDTLTGITLTVTARASNDSVTVISDLPFPRSALEDTKLYYATDLVEGLTSLEGEKVSVVVDGFVVGSPNNGDFEVFTVSGGSIELPVFGSIIHVGRPFTADVGTLDIDTDEQQPTLIESLTVNKMYISVLNTLGLFASYFFPDGNSIVGMENLSEVDIQDDDPLVTGRYQLPRTKRLEVMVPGDWRSQGKICIRQVDPVHFQIRSIIPDCDVEWRSDRS